MEDPTFIPIFLRFVDSAMLAASPLNFLNTVALSYCSRFALGKEASPTKKLPSIKSLFDEKTVESASSGMVLFHASKLKSANGPNVCTIVFCRRKASMAQNSKTRPEKNREIAELLAKGRYLRRHARKEGGGDKTLKMK